SQDGGGERLQTELQTLIRGYVASTKLWFTVNKGGTVMKHQIMSTLAAVCLVLLVFSGPAFAATYEVQSVTGTVAPYSTQNPYSPSLSVLLPTPKVSGSV